MREPRNAARMLAAAFAAAVLMASAVATAPARNLSASSQNIRATWRVLEMTSELVTIRCAVTVEGSFHARTMAKVVGALTGAVTRVSIKEETCTNGRFRPKNVPWHLQYAGFTGSLPNINSILFVISRFRIEVTVSGICTGEYGTPEDRALVTANLTGGAVTSINLGGETRGNLVSGTGFCPRSGSGGGTASVMLLGSTSSISVTLI